MARAVQYRHYQKNARWLMCFAPFKTLSVSTAYLIPFFLENGLSLSEAFALQSAFSVLVVLLEVPSGYFADRFGRAFSIRLSVPLAAASMIAYGFSTQFWQFLVCEAVLAVSYVLHSGADKALLADSLKADGLEKEFTRLNRRIGRMVYIAVVVAWPLAYVLVRQYSLGATLIADGVLVLIGGVFTLLLVEAPRFSDGEKAERKSAWHATKQLGRNVEARWLVWLAVGLSTTTYLGFWLSTPYYTELGIAAGWFSGLLALRSLFKVCLLWVFEKKGHVERTMFACATLAVTTCFAMATGQIWLLWLVLGHDFVQALHPDPVTEELNNHMEHQYRATLHSMVNLVQRLAYSIAGPLVGILVDAAGLSAAFVVIGVVFGGFAFVALARLHRFGTFS